MSVFKEDRSTLNEAAENFDAALSNSDFDAILQQAFEAGMERDEIIFLILSHTNRIVKRYVVQDQLKKAANKDK